ncbi:MAG: rhodanese-like domain-containing protein [Desulfotomaculaceae bacterium]
MIFFIAATILLESSLRRQVYPAVQTEEIDRISQAYLVDQEKKGGYAHPETLISTQELYDLLEDPQTLIIDTRGKNLKIMRTSYSRGHIPGALPILHSDYCHPAYPGQIGTPVQIQNLLAKSGVDNNSRIILYGNDGLQARLYWAIKMYGYDNVAILDGGLEKWQEAELEVSTTTHKYPVKSFTFDTADNRESSMLATHNEVEAVLNNPAWLIVDVRSSDDYNTRHIPGSINMDWLNLIDTDMTFKPAPLLKNIVESKGITPDKGVIVYCADGVESSLLWFVLQELLGYPVVKNYDGSLNEWLSRGKPVKKISN